MLASLFTRTLRSAHTASVSRTTAFTRISLARAYSDVASSSSIEIPDDLRKPQAEPRKPQKEDRKLALNTLHVQNLTQAIDAQGLADYFRKLAPVKEARVLTRRGGAPQGRGYVEFFDESIPQKIIDEVRDEPLYLGSRPLRLEIALEPKAPRTRERRPVFPEIPLADQKKSRTIVVRNIPSVVTQEDVFTFFSKFGQILQVRLPIDSRGNNRRFSFIMFVNVDSAAQAMEAGYSEDGLWMDNSRLNLAFDQSVAGKPTYVPVLDQSGSTDSAEQA